MHQLTGFGDAEIEQAAISALMQWPEKCFLASDERQISSEHFQTAANRVLFDTLSHYWREGKPIELISFTSELRDLGILDSIGGAYYVTQTWCNTCYSALIFRYYLDIIEEAHAKLLLSKTCAASVAESKAPAVEGELLLTSTIEELSAIPLPSRHKAGRRTLAQAVEEKMKRLESGEPAEDMVATGLAELDRMSPLRRGDMPLIAGQRKAGKSVFALSIALNLARRGIGVAYFSLEDRETKLMDRVLANMSRVSMNNHGRIPSEVSRQSEAAAKIAALPLTIIDDVFELARIVAISRELKARKDIGLIVVDYGQLVTVPERRDTNREQRVAEMSRTLRLLAMQLDTPLILLSQLNDAGLTRESRALEQDATAMWRVDHVSKPSKRKSDPEAFEPNQRLIAIPWQRNGESGVGFKVAFLGDMARVETLARQEEDEF